MGRETLQTVYVNALAPGGAWPIVDSSGADAGPPQLVANDRFMLRVYFVDVDPSTGVATPSSFDGSASVMFAVKSLRTSASATLASVELVKDGLYYEGIVNLGTAGAAAAVAAGSPSRVFCDIQAAITDGATSRRMTWQWQTRLNPEVYSGEALPDDPDPVPAARELRYAMVAVPAGSMTVAVTGLTMPAGGYSPVVTVVKPAAEDPDIFAAGVHSITTDGFTVTLSSPPEKEGYYVSYLCV